jgi:hypothetical protein
MQDTYTYKSKPTDKYSTRKRTVVASALRESEIL